MKRIAKSLVLPAAAAMIVVAGCTSSPTAPDTPEPPPVEIRTPISAVIQSISVTKFPAKTSDGSDWDISLITASKRPDLYVILTADGQAADYVSDVVSNAETGKVYTFTKPGSAYDGTLPALLPYDHSRRVYVMDADVGGDPDRLGWITVNLPHAYRGDNARDLDYTFTDSGNRLSVRVRGYWNF
jgi:hypothetical protein